MKMYDPPHPGELIKGLWLDPMGITITEAAQAMGVSRKTLSKIINGRGRVTPEIAVRLSIALGTSAESWLGHQDAYDLWALEQHPQQWDAYRVHRIFVHSDAQPDDEAGIADKAPYIDRRQTMMEIPAELVPAVRELLARYDTEPQAAA
jgi:addiction module HigA family antidote